MVIEYLILIKEKKKILLWFDLIDYFFLKREISMSFLFCLFVCLFVLECRTKNEILHRNLVGVLWVIVFII